MAKLSSTLENLAVERLKKIDSRLTSSRIEILKILESAQKPLTTTDIVSVSRGIAQSSLYRNLNVLEKAKLVTKIVNENDFAFYELDEHVLGHHHHLRCIQCGTVFDIEIDHSIEAMLEKTSKSIAKQYKFTGVNHVLDYTGKCKNCSC